MTETILPSFVRYPKEGQIVGRLVAGYGELEFSLALCLGAIIGDDDAALKAVFRAHGEEQRIVAFDAIMRPAYERLKLKNPYCEAVGDMDFCRRVRNQYAHCHWLDTNDDGLCFRLLEPTSAKPNVTYAKAYKVDVKLLTKQEAYFLYVGRCLWHLADTANRAAGKSSTHPPRRLPKKVDRPPLRSSI